MMMQEITKTATCKRCGATDCAWMKSERTGKFYLVKSHVQDGKLVASPREFHDCQQYREYAQTPAAPAPEAIQAALKDSLTIDLKLTREDAALMARALKAAWNNPERFADDEKPALLMRYAELEQKLFGRLG